MGRRNKRDDHPAPFDPGTFERTLADVEQESKDEGKGGDETTCPCGSREFLLEAFLHVVDGRAKAVPVDVESLTCPECGREFEAVTLEDGRFVKGAFLGRTALDD